MYEHPLAPRWTTDESWCASADADALPYLLHPKDGTRDEKEFWANSLGVVVDGWTLIHRGILFKDDAHLIAATRDLYGVLDDLVRLYDMDLTSDDEFDRDFKDAMKRGGVVLAAARGETDGS